MVNEGASEACRSLVIWTGTVVVRSEQIVTSTEGEVASPELAKVRAGSVGGIPVVVASVSVGRYNLSWSYGHSQRQI